MLAAGEQAVRMNCVAAAVLQSVGHNWWGHHAQLWSFAVVCAGADDACWQNGFCSGVDGEWGDAPLEYSPFVALLLCGEGVGQLQQLFEHRQHAADCWRVVSAAVCEVLRWDVPVAPVGLHSTSHSTRCLCTIKTRTSRTCAGAITILSVGGLLPAKWCMKKLAA